jgi:hypothetical protein
MYAAGMVMLFFLLVGVPINDGPVGLVKTFYEIHPLSEQGWSTVLIVCGVSSLLLFIAQRARAAFLGKAS